MGIGHNAISTGNLAAAIGFVLIDCRFLKPDMTCVSIEDQIAALAYRYFAGSFKGELNHIRIGARRDDEVMFESVVIAIVNDIHAWIYPAIADFAVGWNIGEPFRRVVADKIVCLSRQLVESFNLWG